MSILGQVEIEAAFQCRHPYRLQPGDLGPGEGLVHEVLERPTAPQTQSLAEQRHLLVRRSRLRGTEQVLEPGGVQLLTPDVEPVSRLGGDQRPGREDVAKLGDVGLDHFPGADRRVLPQVLDQAPPRHRGPVVHEQDC